MTIYVVISNKIVAIKYYMQQFVGTRVEMII